jgi:ketosteroid isomerase-like protein
MSHENVEVVKAVLRAQADDAEARTTEQLEALFDPEVCMDMSRRIFNPKTYEGYDGVRQFENDVREIWAEFRMEPERCVEAGDQVVVIAIRRGRARGSGVEVEDRSASIWTLRGGRVVGVQTELSPTEALEAVGLRQ